MDAAADYAEVQRALANAGLPAYVSYVVHASAGFDAMHNDDTTTLVVRTRDGKIVRGKAPKIRINSDEQYANDVVRHPPWDPACYRATNATLTTFESQPVEAIALKADCHDKHDSDQSNNTDFNTLYIDPASHQPVAVIGGSNEQYIKASLDEHFVRAKGFILPSAFSVKVAGSGPMFWLNVDAHETFSEYRFFANMP